MCENECCGIFVFPRRAHSLASLLKNLSSSFCTARRAGADTATRTSRRGRPRRTTRAHTMTDVKSVDVGGALFVDKCVRDRAPLNSLIRRPRGALRQPDGWRPRTRSRSRRGLNPLQPPRPQVLRCENQGMSSLKPPVQSGSVRTRRSAHDTHRLCHPRDSIHPLGFRRLSSSASRTRALTHTSVTHQLL